MRTILAVIMLTIATLSGCSSTQAAPETAVGVYSDDSFRAEITSDQIDVYIVDGSDKSLYWRGTWDDGEAQVVSAADREALDSSLFGSGADNKEFTVDDSSLEFEFQAMGSTKTVSLDKE